LLSRQVSSNVEAPCRTRPTRQRKRALQLVALCPGPSENILKIIRALLGQHVLHCLPAHRNLDVVEQEKPLWISRRAQFEKLLASVSQKAETETADGKDRFGAAEVALVTNFPYERHRPEPSVPQLFLGLLPQRVGTHDFSSPGRRQQPRAILGHGVALARDVLQLAREEAYRVSLLSPEWKGRCRPRA
jgi:hypothetical protein